MPNPLIKYQMVRPSMLYFSLLDNIYYMTCTMITCDPTCLHLQTYNLKHTLTCVLYRSHNNICLWQWQVEFIGVSKELKWFIKSKHIETEKLYAKVVLKDLLTMTYWTLIHDFFTSMKDFKISSIYSTDTWIMDTSKFFFINYYCFSQSKISF